MKHYNELTKEEKIKYGYPELPVDNLLRPISQFLDWEQQNVAAWILSEARVAYPERGYAGTLDAVAIMIKDDDSALLDFKFANHFSEDHSLQTAGYKACFEPYGIKLDKRIIVRLPKTLTKEEWNPQKYCYEIIENSFEVKEIDTPYELDRDAFFAALIVKRWINAVCKK